MQPQAPPGEARSIAAAVESIEHAVGGALHDVSSLPAPLPMTAAAMGVVPRTAPAGDAADAACGRPADTGANNASAEAAEGVFTSRAASRQVRGYSVGSAP